MRLWRSAFNQKGYVDRIQIIVKIWQTTIIDTILIWLYRGIYEDKFCLRNLRVWEYLFTEVFLRETSCQSDRQPPFLDMA